MDKTSTQQDEQIKDLPLTVTEAGKVKGGGIKVPQVSAKRPIQPCL